ncbi:MAG: methionyl-tRNA formyltransferase [Bacteroidetes bacterium]|nr:methionyl-tRNA formyltransferase [Bacteroidota bacterium]
MGTPEFSVPMLEAIHNSQHKLVGVVTALDKPAGRGRKLKKSAVKTFAESKGLTVLQPKNLKSEEFFTQIKTLNPNIIFVVAFRMLPKQVWKFPKYGTINLHASLLPDYRGAAPINWAIINGEKQTGLTTFFIDDKIDTGHIIDYTAFEISETDNVKDVYEKMIPRGVKLSLSTLSRIAQEDIKPIPQKNAETSKKAPKLNKDNTRIDWNQTGQSIYNFIRGLSPYPAAWTILVNYDEEIYCKILKANFNRQTPNTNNGKIIIDNKTMLVGVKDGLIEIEEIKLSGKRLMKAVDLLNGFDLDKDAKML